MASSASFAPRLAKSVTPGNPHIVAGRHILVSLRHHVPVRTSLSRLAILTAAMILPASCTGGPLDGASPETTTSANGPSPTHVSTPQVTDLASFADGLEAVGYSVTVGGRTGLEAIFGVRGHVVRIDGSQVLAFEYPTESAFEDLKASVSKDGEMVGSAIVEWSRPHLYGSGTLIVVYLGNGPDLMRVLQGLLGAQFAGS